MRNLALLFIFSASLASLNARRIHPLSNEPVAPHDEARQTQRRLNHATERRVSVVVPTSPDSHLVEDLPLLANGEINVKHWAGHLPASAERDKYFFYWLFAPEGDFDAENVPLIIWLNGGPGCSSMDGLFLENGPLRLRKDESGNFQIKSEEYSWHKAPAYTLYIDQPVGTGLSFTTSQKYPRNDQEVNADFYHFLQSFYKLHSDKFVKDSTAQNPLFFSGESHAGHYIPHMMNHILKENDDLKSGNVRINLAGAAIGNGWTDPYHQYSAARAAYGHGIIDHAQVMALDVKEKECQQKLAAGQYDVGSCFALLDDIVSNSQGSSLGYILSMYDVRKTEHSNSAREFPPGHKVVETYLGGVSLASSRGNMSTSLHLDVLKAIHAEAASAAGQNFRECTDPPYNALKHQDGKGVVDDLVAVLEHEDNVRVLFFNGIEDLICNHVGNEIMLENLPWKHKDEWTKASRYGWQAANEDKSRVSGYVKEFNNLSFLKVLNSGHMVPMDVPDVAFDMMRLFTSGVGFSMSEQRLGRATTDGSVCPTCQECKRYPDTFGDQGAADKSPPESANNPAPTGSKSGILISYSTLVAVLGGVAFCGVMLVFRKNRRSRVRHAVVPQLETEMSVQYTD